MEEGSDEINIDLKENEEKDVIDEDDNDNS